MGVVLACQAAGSATPTPQSAQPSPSIATLIPTAAPTEVPRTPAGPRAGTQLLYVDGSTLIYIPEGEFQMGGGGNWDAVHTVNLTSYWIQRTEVTDRMYSICAAKGACKAPAAPDTVMRMAASAFIDTPIVGVTWDEAGAYCSWIGGTLPTEAQWEKAAAGTDHNPYPWGTSEPTCDLLNFNGCVGSPVRGARYSDSGGPYGVLDMAGNVSEWVSDLYGYAYYHESPAVDPTGPAKGDGRVVRGSNYASPPEDVPVWTRDSRAPGSGREDLGFRCVVKSPQYFAPYCRTSPRDPNLTAGEALSLPDHCSPSAQRDSIDCHTSFTHIAPGTLTTLQLAPGGQLASCNPLDDSHVYCVGLGKGKGVESGILNYCVACPGTASGTAPDLACPAGYKLNSASGRCEYQGALAANDCPLGSQLNPAGMCVYAGTLESCPEGSYFDEGLQACATIAPPTEDCIKGFTFGYEHACCQVHGLEGVYPTCSVGEYMVAGYGCLPIPDGKPIESCSFFTVAVGQCP
jgi:formylglycine-generating enzyme required for sulfatase activity